MRPLAVFQVVVSLSLLALQLVVAPAPSLWLCALGVLGLAWAVLSTARTRRARRTPPHRPAEDLTQYLTAADRAWLSQHGWQPSEPDAVQPERSAWEKACVRALAAEAARLSARVEEQRPRRAGGEPFRRPGKPLHFDVKSLDRVSTSYSRLAERVVDADRQALVDRLRNRHPYRKA